jgi:hypothetical protein
MYMYLVSATPKNSINSLVGVALTRYMDGRTDGRTDRVIPIYPPPNFVRGGIMIL